MDKILESLKEYLRNTPKGQIQQDWDQFSCYDEVGPTIEEFKAAQERIALINSKDLDPEIIDLVNDKFWDLV